MTPEQARFEALRLACEYTVQTDADQIVADAEKFREFLIGPEITERVVTVELPAPPPIENPPIRVFVKHEDKEEKNHDL